MTAKPEVSFLRRFRQVSDPVSYTHLDVYKRQVFFYTDLTNPYAGYVPNLQKLKSYNRLMFPLAMALHREL